MSLALRVLVGLVIGLATGLVLIRTGHQEPIVQIVEPLGQLWVNALRMTVIPMVVSCLVVSVGSSHNTAAIGRLGRRALALFVVLLAAAAIFSMAIALPLLELIPVHPDVAVSLRDASDPARQEAAGAGLADWLLELVPANPVKAAADGAMLPLIVFALLLGLAVRRAGDEPAQTVLGFFQGIAEAMFVLVRWVLAVAPLGVMALTIPLATRSGFSMVGTLATYVVLVVGLTLLFGLVVLYPVATIGAGVPFRRFVQAILPAQAVAFSSRSSLASLPVMIEGARNTLGLGEEVTVFLIPLAGSIFRVGSAVAQTTGVLFLARLIDVSLNFSELLTVLFVVILTTFSVPGVPGGTIIAITPVLLAVGLPASGVGLLLAADAIPDMFRTAANVTGAMTAAVVLGRQALTVPPTVIEPTP